MPNFLIHENSPYLLQHAYNPVEWYPWSEKALQLSKEQNKLIFLSIGYAACHWCHVMESESFEDADVAQIMNDNFINIKVDREERPDLDNIYMTATVEMTGSGGWPMSVFLTPDQKPIFAGTYFPPVRRFNKPSFRELLLGISSFWRSDPDECKRIGDQVGKYLIQVNEPPRSTPIENNEEILKVAVSQIAQNYDWEFGGWGNAPKFPQPMILEFLLDRIAYSRRNEKSNIEELIEYKIVTHCLSKMSQGGMYDILCGGFSRYSVDHRWHTPHFEKMLYDNSQLAIIYLRAFLITKNPDFKQICIETLDFLITELMDPLGGFYCSLDADSEGEEGKFYTWEISEIKAILGDNFKQFSKYFSLEGVGDSSGRMILRRVDMLASNEDASLMTIEYWMNLLRNARAKRIRPKTDDKILVSWNALTLLAFSEAARYLGRSDYLEVSKQLGQFILSQMVRNDRLYRSYRNGNTAIIGTLEDYASLALAMEALYQSDPNPDWYQSSLWLTDQILKHFSGEELGFFDSRDDAEKLLVRPKSFQDNATPSGNSLAINSLIRLAAYGDRPDYYRLAENILSPLLLTITRTPFGFGKWLVAAQQMLYPIMEVALLGDKNDSNYSEMVKVLWGNYQPGLIFATSNLPLTKGSPSLLKNRAVINSQATAFVCQNMECKYPTNDHAILKIQIS